MGQDTRLAGGGKGKSLEKAPPAVPYQPQLGSHIPALDAIRGLAILIVTAFRFHEGPADNTAIGGAVFKLLRQGEHGVDLFFVLSGFLITGILYDAKGSQRYFRNFYIRRTLRIFPLYYGVLFLTLVVLPLLVPLAASLFAVADRHQAWLWLYGSNFLLAQKEAWFLDGFTHFWSLAVEEHFYLVWPLVIFFCSRRAAMLACGGFIVVAVALRVGLSAVGGHDVAIEVLTPCRMDALALGGLLALAARGPGGPRGLVRWVVGAAVLGSLFLAGVWAWSGSTWSLEWSLYPCWFGALIVLAITTDPARWPGRFWNSRALQFCGKYSYGWYVFQGLLVPVLPVLFSADDLAFWLDSPFGGRILFILWGGTVSLAVALLSWHLYEKHFLRLKNVLARPERRPKDLPQPGYPRQKAKVA